MPNRARDSVPTRRNSISSPIATTLLLSLTTDYVRKGHGSELSGCKRLFYFLYTNLSFYIAKFATSSARWVYVTAPISMYFFVSKNREEKYQRSFPFGPRIFKVYRQVCIWSVFFVTALIHQESTIISIERCLPIFYSSNEKHAIAAD